MIKYGKDVIKCTDIPKFLTSVEAFLSGRGKAYHTFINDIEIQVK